MALGGANTAIFQGTPYRGMHGPGHPIRDLKGVYPEQLNFVKHDRLADNVHITKEPKFFVPDRTVHAPGETARIELHNDIPVADFRQGRITFTMTITQPPGFAAWLPFHGAHCIIKRIMVKASGRDVDDIQDYNKKACLMLEMSTKVGIAVTQSMMWGTGTLAERQAAALAPIEITMPLTIMHFLLRQPIPLTRLTEKTALEIEFESVVRGLDGTSSVGANYSISNLRLWCHQLDDRSSGQSYWRSIQLGFTPSSSMDWGHSQIELVMSAPQPASTHWVVPLQNKSAIVEHIICYIQADGFDRSITNLDKHITWPKNGMLNYRINRQGRFWPIQNPIDTTGNAHQAYLQVLTLIKQWRADGIFEPSTQVSVPDYNADRFLFVIPINHLAEDGLVNNEGNAEFTANVEIEINFGGAVAGVLFAFFGTYQQKYLHGSGVFDITSK